MSTFTDRMSKIGLETKTNTSSHGDTLTIAKSANLPSGRAVGAGDVDCQPQSIEELEMFKAYKGEDIGMRWRLTLSEWRAL